MSLKFEFVSSIQQIEPEKWNDLNATGYPFTRYEFIQALEQSGSTTAETGWQTYHLLGWEDGNLVLIVPLYLKTHSYGEYVFDWAWADAYQRNGMHYYPKLLNAIPFTPVTGPRVLTSTGLNINDVQSLISQALIDESERLGLSSIHCLFNTESISEGLVPHQFMQRHSVQFQWFNRNYANFEDFLATFASRKRKNVKKERAKVMHSEVEVSRIVGSDISSTDMQHFYHCYRQTYLKRSGHNGYLTQAFFDSLLETMPSNLMLVLADRKGEKIAAALYLYDKKNLYGRYWGTLEDIDGLHFECCYYQGIEFCIENKLTSFNPGTQGEHKIMRGFEPIYCYSNHWISHPDFKNALQRFLTDEKHHISAYKEQAATLLPFKKEL